MALTDTTVRNLKATGKVQKIADGRGLYLHVTATGTKLWRMAYRVEGKQKTLSFGEYPTVTLSEAREKREDAKKLLSKGIDPGAHKKATKAAEAALKKQRENTFESVARDWYKKHSSEWSGPYAEKILIYLENNYFPVMGDIEVKELESPHFLEVLRPYEEQNKLDTAYRLASLGGRIMHWAQIRGKLRYNVATKLSKALPPYRGANYPTITEPKAIGRLLRDIDEYHGDIITKFYLQILPYVFTRPSELRLAVWEEFDFDDAMWRIPAHRMKMRREHFVPLAAQVISRLHDLRQHTGDGQFLFPSARGKSRNLADATPIWP